MIVAFGPTHDSYFLAHGNKYFAKNLPSSLQNKLTSGQLNPAHMTWMSIAKDGQRWAADNTLTGRIWWDSKIGERIQNAFLGNPSLAPPSNYVSFPEESDGHFLKGINPGAWSAELADIYVNSVREAQRDIDGFDLGLKRILFGVGGSHIFCFDNGFQAKLEGVHDQTGNSLNKVLREFASRGPGWIIAPGSALSLHDPHMFVLVFQHLGSGMEEIRWVAPQQMSDRITELIRAASDPASATAASQTTGAGKILQSPPLLGYPKKESVIGLGDTGLAARKNPIYPPKLENRSWQNSPALSSGRHVAFS